MTQRLLIAPWRAPACTAIAILAVAAFWSGAVNATAAPPRRAAKTADTPLGRFAPPAGAQRIAVDANSFGDWLRRVPLRAAGTPVLMYDGKPKPSQDNHAAVLDFDVGKRDLQQCADAVMRLRAEYLWSVGKAKQACFRTAAGKSLRFGGESHAAVRSWLDHVYAVANTASLRRQLVPVAEPRFIQPGDVYVVGASGKLRIGHALTVMDVAEDANGQRWAMLSQGFMPAQDIHVLTNKDKRTAGVWFRVPADGSMPTQEWNFGPRSLHRFGPAACGR